MKNQKAMLAIAKDAAYYDQPETSIEFQGQIIIGYFLPYSQLLKIYLQEGFTENALKKHLAVWKSLGNVRTFHKFVFFVPEEEDIQNTLLARERAAHPDALVIMGATA